MTDISKSLNEFVRTIISYMENELHLKIYHDRQVNYNK